jgi:hypothetical protein
VRVIRSARRSRTVSARMNQGVLEVRIPARMSRASEAHWVDRMRAKVLAGRSQRVPPSDASLRQEADALNVKYFGGALRYESIRYVDNQQFRWGSCTPSDGTIRVSSRLASVPAWVREYVIVHELAHLLEPNHSADFWKLVSAFPLTERARGYLLAVAGEAGGEDTTLL